MVGERLVPLVERPRLVGQSRRHALGSLQPADADAGARLELVASAGLTGVGVAVVHEQPSDVGRSQKQPIELVS